MIYIFRSIIQPSLPYCIYSKMSAPCPPKKRSVFDSIFAVVASKGPFFFKICNICQSFSLSPLPPPHPHTHTHCQYYFFCSVLGHKWSTWRSVGGGLGSQWKALLRKLLRFFGLLFWLPAATKFTLLSFAFRFRGCWLKSRNVYHSSVNLGAIPIVRIKQTIKSGFSRWETQ